MNRGVIDLILSSAECRLIRTLLAVRVVEEGLQAFSSIIKLVERPLCY